MALATPVIIPCRNEEKTIGAIVAKFNDHSETQGRVYVGIDADTTDNTSDEALKAGAVPIFTNQRGKGQVILATLSFPMPYSARVLLCDGDYIGLSLRHITALTTPTRGMVIGVPDYPEIPGLPNHVLHAWPRVSGFRCLPIGLIPANAHGYLLETQLNLRAIRTHLPIRTVYCDGLKAPFQWPLTKKRHEELERDKDWGIRNGVL